MGNAWKGISDEKLALSEKVLLLHDGKISENDITIENVNLDGRA